MTLGKRQPGIRKVPIVFPELQSPLGQRVADKPENQAATIANLRTRIAQVFDRETWCITGILRAAFAQIPEKLGIAAAWPIALLAPRRANRIFRGEQACQSGRNICEVRIGTAPLNACRRSGRSQPAYHDAQPMGTIAEGRKPGGKEPSAAKKMRKTGAFLLGTHPVC